MEFKEKIQQLRKQKNFTQEELAALLFVSRTAISKWESGRGYPSIDSLKAISKVFSISIDELLSSKEIITIAEEDKKKTALNLRNLLYGLMDLMLAVLFLLPIFGQKNNNVIEFVSLFEINKMGLYISIPYIMIFGIIMVYGIVEIVLQNLQNKFWNKYITFISLGLTIIGITIFIMTQQPYMAIFFFWTLLTKGFLYIKQR
jgi:transcriptional regulator with XRE-family HTH domain